jgi:hypothetical protein
MDMEKYDPLKSSTISFKFICFKTPWKETVKIPSKFYFQLKFFTFPLLLTEKVIIKKEAQKAPQGIEETTGIVKNQ